MGQGVRDFSKNTLASRGLPGSADANVKNRKVRIAIVVQALNSEDRIEFVAREISNRLGSLDTIRSSFGVRPRMP